VQIDWEDSQNREHLEIALKEVYKEPEDLEKFVDRAINENLTTITSANNLEQDIFKLVRWARSKGCLNKLYGEFCSRNSTNPIVVKLKQNLKGRESLVPVLGKTMHRSDWDDLWKNFTDQTSPYMHPAFFSAYKSVFDESYHAMHLRDRRMEHDDIRKWLEHFDKPAFAVRFVEQVIAEVGRSGEGNIYQLNSLRAWRDRIAKKYRILPGKPRLSKASRQGYLLVCLKESGKQTKDEKDFVIPFAELRVSGESDAIPFNQNTETCSLRQVESRLSEFICSAEEVLAEYGCSQVTLELFLPCVHLDVDVASWKVLNADQKIQPLGTHRRFAVRSLERATSLDARKSLSKKWNLLKACVKANDACYQFHLQESWPNPGELKTPLAAAPGIMLSATLPEDQTKRLKVLSEIIDSAVPIALWFSASSSLNMAQRRTKFDTLLRASTLTDLGDLSHQWGQLREDPNKLEGRHLRVLCDSPERWPELPDKEEDSIVAPY